MVNYFDAKSFENKAEIKNLLTFENHNTLHTLTLSLDNGKYIVTEYVWTTPVADQYFSTYEEALEKYLNCINRSIKNN